VKHENVKKENKMTQEEYDQNIAQLAKDGIKMCPMCKSFCYKLDGCNVVECTNDDCKVAFCWICYKFQSKNHDDVYDHIDEQHPDLLFE